MRVAGVVAAVALVGSCGGQDPSANDTEFLSADAHVTVGDVTIVAPFVALRNVTTMGQFFAVDRRKAREEWRAQRDAFRKAAEDPVTAPKLSKVEIGIDSYGEHGREDICDGLTRQWSRSICVDMRGLLLYVLPDRFYLADALALEAFDNHHTVGNETAGAQLRSMEITNDPAYRCDAARSASGTLFCTAAVRIQGNMIAVWNVWDGGPEQLPDMTLRQGKAIQAFVAHGLGPTENFEELIRISCDLREPNSSWSAELDEFCSR